MIRGPRWSGLPNFPRKSQQFSLVVFQVRSSGPTSAKHREYNSGAVVTTTVISTCPQEDTATQLHMQRDRPYWASYRHPMGSLSSGSSNNSITTKQTSDRTWLSRHLRINMNQHTCLMTLAMARFHKQDVAVKNRERAGLGAFLGFPFNGGSHRATLHPPAPQNGWTLNGLSGHELGQP